MPDEPDWSSLIAKVKQHLGYAPQIDLPGPTRIAGMNRRIWSWLRPGSTGSLAIDCHDKIKSDQDFEWRVSVGYGDVYGVYCTYTLSRLGCPTLAEVQRLLQLVNMVPTPQADLSPNVQSLVAMIKHWRDAKFAIPTKVLEALDRVESELREAATHP